MSAENPLFLSDGRVGGGWLGDWLIISCDDKGSDKQRGDGWWEGECV